MVEDNSASADLAGASVPVCVVNKGLSLLAEPVCSDVFSFTTTGALVVSMSTTLDVDDTVELDGDPGVSIVVSSGVVVWLELVVEFVPSDLADASLSDCVPLDGELSLRAKSGCAVDASDNTGSRGEFSTSAGAKDDFRLLGERSTALEASVSLILIGCSVVEDGLSFATVKLGESLGREGDLLVDSRLFDGS